MMLPTGNWQQMMVPTKLRVVFDLDQVQPSSEIGTAGKSHWDNGLGVRATPSTEFLGWPAGVLNNQRIEAFASDSPPATEALAWRPARAHGRATDSFMHR